MPDIFIRPKKKSIERKPAAIKTPEKQYVPVPTHVDKTKVKSDSLSMFATFLKYPQGIELSGQDDDEKTIIFLRADFFTNFSWIFSTILFALLPLFLPLLLNLTNLSVDFLPLRLIILIISFYYLILIGYAFANFVTWFYTIGIATDKKAFDIDFNNLSSIDVSTVNLQDASDAKYSQLGFFQSFFDYGDVTITIEATKEKLVFEKVPKPALVADIVGDMIGGE